MNFINNLNCVNWPCNSPDINPIENLWAILKERMRKLDCMSKEHMISSLIQVWFKDNEVKEMCEKLVRSRPNRVKSLLKQKEDIFNSETCFLRLHMTKLYF